MRKLRPSYRLLCLTVVFLVSVGCGEERRGETTAAADARPLRIMDPLEANNLHVPLAESEGYFRDEGLNVEVSYTSAGKFAMDALNARAVDYAVVVDMNIAQALFEHDDLAILTELAEPVSAVKFLGRRDHGISESSDLVGKRIGVLFGVNIHLFVLRYLDAHGIDREDVQLINLRPPDAVSAFESGDVDAIVTWQPHVYRLVRALGDEVVVLADDAKEYWTYKMLVATRRSYLQDHPDEAESLVRALVRADRLIDEEPSRAMERLAAHLNMDEGAVRSFFSEIHFETRLTGDLLRMLEVELDWLQEEFFDKREPVTRDVRALIAPQLAQVSPEAVLIDDVAP